MANRLSKRSHVILLFMIFFSAYMFSPIPYALAQNASDINQSIIILRFTERFIVVFAGITLLVLGFRLFSKSQDLGDLSAEYPNKFKIRISQVGPGVFFALFGTIILVYVMYSEVSVSDPVSGSEVRLYSNLADMVSNEEEAAKLAWALETLKTNAQSDTMATTERAQKTLRDALSLVTNAQSSLVDVALKTEGAYRDWAHAVNRQKSDPDYVGQLGQEVQNRIERVRKILDEGEL